ncbi:MAG: DUF4886 domain-containing protein [Bacilli bacterium]|nr:DUF4886 domain-containing protein [Bacilli bacterium]
MKSLKVLAIGNSFSQDSVEYLWDIAKNAGYTDIRLGNLIVPGCSLERHWKNANFAIAEYLYAKNTNGVWIETPSVKLKDGILDEEWDVITLQQASGKSGLPGTYQPYLNNLINFIREYNQNCKILWNMTWAYPNGSDHPHFDYYNNDQYTMYKAIVNAVREVILTNDSISGVIPTGTAIQNMRTSVIGDNLNRDGFHLSLDYGRYIASLMWFKALTTESIDKITYRPDSVAIDMLEVIKKAVNCAYEHPFEVIEL